MTEGGDCDDTRADIFPGQLERCDGRNDSCDPAWTPASVLGLVTWTDGLRVVDYTEAFVSTEAGAPATPELPTTGVLSICRAEEVHAVRLWEDSIEQLSIVGVAIPLDTDDTGTDHRPILNGASSFDTGPVIALSGGAVTITGVQVTGGVATSVRSGGGLHLSGLQSVGLSDVRVYGNSAPEGSVLEADGRFSAQHWGVSGSTLGPSGDVGHDALVADYPDGYQARAEPGPDRAVRVEDIYLYSDAVYLQGNQPHVDVP